MVHSPSSPVALWQGLLRALLTTEIAPALGDIPWVLLKGEPLGEILYGCGAARPTGDLDLLVLPGDVDEAHCRLKAAGLVDLGGPPRMWIHNQRALLHRPSRAIVELHWALAELIVPQPPVGFVVKRAEPFPLTPDFHVKVLPNPLLLLHLALHFHHHLGHPRGLRDIQDWWARFGHSRASHEAFELADRFGMRGILEWPLAILGEVAHPEHQFARQLAWLWRWALDRDLIGPAGPRGSKATTVALRSAAMLLTGNDLPTTLNALRLPITHGPHRLGRWLRTPSAAPGRGFEAPTPPPPLPEIEPPDRTPKTYRTHRMSRTSE